MALEVLRLQLLELRAVEVPRPEALGGHRDAHPLGRRRLRQPPQPAVAHQLRLGQVEDLEAPQLVQQTFVQARQGVPSQF